MSTFNPRQFLTGYSGIQSTDLARFLKRRFTAKEQALADDLIRHVEADFAALCERNFAFQDQSDDPEPIQYKERFDTGRVTYYPAAFPVQEIIEVKVAGQVQDLEENEDYFIYDDHIEFESALSSSGDHRRALEITYTIRKFWGDDVILAIKKCAGRLWLSSEAAGVHLSDRMFSSIRETFDNEAFEKEISQVVRRYRPIHI